MDMKQRLGRFPAAHLLPVAIALGMNFLAFYGTRVINSGFRHYDLSLPIDGMIPFVPAFIVFYILAYVQWGVNYLLLCHETCDRVCRFCSWTFTAKVLSAVVFLVLPTAMVRPEINESGILGWLVGLIYGADTPDTLFPSFHCLESWFCVRCAFAMDKGRGMTAYRVVSVLLTLAVFASVVLVKQHLFVDIFGGIAFLEIGKWISDRTGLWKWASGLTEALDRKIGRKGTVE